ncbi:MAG: IS1634 family transposase [Proteobacteria bacterium]|nr:IS1634 family transposase [Pseudomonadota bacterium]
MYVEVVPNHGSDKKTVLIRRSYWEDGRSHKQTIANITKLPKKHILQIKRLLKNKNATVLTDRLEGMMKVTRTLSHGHVVAVKGFMNKLNILKIICDQKSQYHSICLAMIASRIVDPEAKMLVHEGWPCDQQDSANSDNSSHHLPKSTLGIEFGVTESKEDDLYRAMDWLLEKQDDIEKKLAKKHLKDLKEGALVLNDLTSVYMEGTTCPISYYGGSRDNKKEKGKLQIEFGLLTNRDGCPVAVEVFEGNAADPLTVSHQIDKLRHKFGLKKIIFACDRGMVTQINIKKDLKPFGIDWISALKKSSLTKIMATREESMQTSLFDTHDICEVESDEYPGMRLIICHNPYREATRRRKREDALNLAEKDLSVAQEATQRKKYALKGRQKIKERVLRILNRHHVQPFFDIEIEDNLLIYTRNKEAICEENNIDGLYVMTTNLSKKEMSAKKAISSYKNLDRFERAFRSLKEVDKKVRAVNHRIEGRVKAHVFLCVLAYYVEWHMKQALKPLLVDDELFPEYSVTTKEKFDSAKHKASTRCNREGFRYHTFSSLIKDLSTISMCWMKCAGHKSLITSIARPTPFQKTVFKQLKIKLNHKS